ncbi:MAG: hypothetical protein GXO92_01385 [FCB group bacterium]|nr:hypothetical protein [FCB group bacterium]
MNRQKMRFRNSHIRTIVRLLVIIFFTMLLIPGCPDVVEDPYPPAKPVLVEKSHPEDWVEQGIDADNAGKDRIVLMWRPNTEDDLSGYIVYRADSTADNEFRPIAMIDLFQNIETDTMYYDDSLSTYVRYFYYLTAVDLAENESRPSDTVSYLLLNSPLPHAPVNESVDSNVIFEWMDRASHYYYSNEYVIRLERLYDINNIEAIWICRFTNVWFGYENTTPIPFPYFPAGSQNWPDNVISCKGKVDTLSPGLYRWKVKAIGEVDNKTGLDESGGESEWAYFSIE